MGKSLPSPTSLHSLTRLILTNRINNIPSQIRPVSTTARPFVSSDPADATFLQKSESIKQHPVRSKKKMQMGNSNSPSPAQPTRLPLADVVADCATRWFQDTLKEAEAGDLNMQVLVGQMYYSGYGVPQNAQKGRAWIDRASKSRSSASKVGDKHPGYNASDSDSDAAKGN